MPPRVAIGPAGWAMIGWRLPLMALVLFGGLGTLLALRLVERPLCGLRRPLTPFVAQIVCRLVLPIMGLRLVRRGTPMRRRGALVANHTGWLDIFALNAAQRICFVSKSEVATWPVIGWLARATGTVFINRDARDARLQKEIFEARLRAGHRLAFFPEGTSTDGLRVLAFKPTLFAAFFTHGLDAILSVQPVSLVYTAPPGRDARFYGWWGDLDFGTHLLRVLAQTRRGRVEVVFHPPVPVAEAADRKALARRCEAAVRAGLAAHLPGGCLRH
jgi:lyso-ornithine lipid O-acyltransferase